MTPNKIKEFAKNSIFDSFKQIGKWKGFDVWEAGFKDEKPRYTGFPQFILVKGGIFRWTEDWKESQEIMTHFD